MILGRITGVSDDGEQMMIASNILGTIQIELEQLSRVVYKKSKKIKQSNDDQIQLLNGQILSGFINKIGVNSVEIQVGESDDVSKIPMGNVASVVLANPIKQNNGKFHLLTLHDQQKIKAINFSYTNGKWFISPQISESNKVILSGLAVQRIDVYTPHGKLVPLSALNRSQEKRKSVFGLKNQTTNQTNNIEIQAPYTVTYDLPDRAEKFVANIGLKNGNSHGAGWANSILRVYLDNKLVKEYNITLKNNNIEMNISIKGVLSLKIELDPGVNGPIMDQVILNQPMILIR